MAFELTNFLGYRVAQSVYAIPYWERLFVLVPQFSRIIELGTGNGGFSCYLKLCAMRFWIPLYTFDVRPFQKTRITDALSLDGSFTMLDILAPQSEETIGGLIKHNGRTILYCDNGHKISEFKMYAKYLKPGDLIGAHDWGDEIHDEDVAEAISENDLQHIPIGKALEEAAVTKFFAKGSGKPRTDGTAKPEGVEIKMGGNS